MSKFSHNIVLDDKNLPHPIEAFGLFLFSILLVSPLIHLALSPHIRASIVVSQICAVLLPTLIFSWWRKYDWRRIFPIHRLKLGTLLIIIVATLVVASATEYCVRLMQVYLEAPPPFEGRHPELFLMNNWQAATITILSFAVLPAIAEEIFFRGFCQTAFTNSWGSKTGLLASSVFFALAHNNLWYFHLYFILGLFLGFLRQRKENLLWPIAAHFVNNAWTLIYKFML